ncbi:MAG: hypothetical protein LUE86_10170 [Clostridiales bacterium]|nr:hypothetical protein [Clostridiales bacterium]
MKEQFGLYQQKERTTIVIYHMREATKKKLIDVLFNDLKAEGGEAPIQEDIPDLFPDIPDDFFQEEDDIPVDWAYSTIVDDIGTHYDDDPDGTLAELMQVKYTATDIGDRKAATKAFGLFLMKASKEAPVGFLSHILYSYRNEPEFSETLLKMVAQKGCGMDLSVPSQDYDAAVSYLMPLLSIEEAAMAIESIAEKYQ